MNTNVFAMNGVKVSMRVIASLAMTNAIIDENGNMPNLSKHPLMGVLPTMVVPTEHGNLYIGYLVELDTSNKLPYNRLTIHNTHLYATYNTELLYGGDENYITIAVNSDIVDTIAATVIKSGFRVKLLVVY